MNLIKKKNSVKMSISFTIELQTSGKIRNFEMVMYWSIVFFLNILSV